MSTDQDTIEPVLPARCRDGSVGSSTQGLILPGDSNLVQFQVTCYRPDVHVIWVDRTPLSARPSNRPGAHTCTCNGPWFRWSVYDGTHFVVCLCMGIFAE